MKRIMFVLVVIGALMVAGLAQAAPAVPYKAGATWVYRVQKTTAQRQPSTETLTVVYKGEAKFRDKTYHLLESRSSLSRATERNYLVWAGSYFRHAATVVVQGQKTTEIIFNKPFAMSGVAERIAGTTQNFENGEEKSRGAVSIAVSKDRTTKVTVPAGTYTADRWNGTLIMGNLKQIYVVDSVGPLEIRGDFEVYEGGAFAYRMLVELQKGLVPK